MARYSVYFRENKSKPWRLIGRQEQPVTLEDLIADGYGSCRSDQIRVIDNGTKKPVSKRGSKKGTSKRRAR